MRFSRLPVDIGKNRLILMQLLPLMEQTGTVVIDAINELTSDVTAGPALVQTSVAATVAAIQGMLLMGQLVLVMLFLRKSTLTGTIYRRCCQSFWSSYCIQSFWN